MPANVLKLQDRNAVICRPYELRDIPKIVNTVMREVPHLPHYRGINVDPARVRFLLEHSVGNENDFMARVLCDTHSNEVVGGIAAYCTTSLLSWDKIAGDIFLYIEPDYRSIVNVIRLIRSYAKWGEDRGAKLIQATHTSGYKSEALGGLLRRTGFEKVGELYHYRSQA